MKRVITEYEYQTRRLHRRDALRSEGPPAPVEHAARRQHRVSRPTTLALDENGGSWRGRPRLMGDVFPVRADHDSDVVRPRLLYGAKRMSEHRTTCDLMKGLRPARAHAHALAGRKDDDQATPALGTHVSLLDFQWVVPLAHGEVARRRQTT